MLLNLYDVIVGDKVVAQVKNEDLFFQEVETYKNTLSNDHGNALQTRYAHMSNIYVNAGQTVSKGQKRAVGLIEKNSNYNPPETK